MGIEPGPNGYELGDPCVFCEAAKTPKRVLCMVTGVSACPGFTDSPNDIYILGQSAGCQWQGSNDLFDVTYNAVVFLPLAGASFSIVDKLLNLWFTGFVPSMCAKSFSNLLQPFDCDPWTHGHGGSAGVIFGPGI